MEIEIEEMIPGGRARARGRQRTKQQKGDFVMLDERLNN